MPLLELASPSTCGPGERVKSLENLRKDTQSLITDRATGGDDVSADGIMLARLFLGGSLFMPAAIGLIGSLHSGQAKG
jgi:hypothetical protein